MAVITLNRPERLNTLTEAMIAGVADGIDAATASKSVRSVIIRGAGRVLTAGYDLTPDGVDDATDMAAIEDAWSQPVRRPLARAQARRLGSRCGTTSSWARTSSGS